ncbi:MAG: DUF2207 domain-containing protein [Oscillospiraceae bacterium]|nr:DUF2207 domain-containing protein [Oscillospiraceae bacterium]
MKRLLAMIGVCILLMGVICMPASAESMASKVDLLCTVNSEGDCLVTMSVTLRLEQAYQELTFPLPASAKDITLNNSSAITKKTDSAVQVDISRYTRDYVGELPLVFNFKIPEAVKVSTDEIKLGEERKLVLTIPMLNGFELPVQYLSFIINMPSSDMTDVPNFTSIYRQESVGSDLTYKINKNQIIGSSKTTLNDHDGVTMTMVVPKEMFPTVSTYVREGNPEIVPMIVCGVLALLYWLIFLRTLPLGRSRTSTAPEGITAGELGCRLTLSGGDLTMMVFSWAQLGYILIHMDGNGRILLHKRMDMGNERNQFENKVYRSLFGSRRVVEATGDAYARLCRKVAGYVPLERNMYKGNSGNMKIFRGLACGTQVFCGICVAMNMTTIPVLYVLMGIILSVFGAISAWLIQDIAYRNHLRGKTPVLIGFVCILIWIVLGLLCGQVWIPLCSCLAEFVMGYFAAYGGRRSDLGRHDASQVLGLRNYVKHLPRDEIGRLMQNDPDYFFNMAPYALALGVINPFAKAFGRRKLDQCPYLMSRVSGKRTAEEWGHLMADAADMMDAKARRMQIEKWTAIQIRVTKK